MTDAHGRQQLSVPGLPCRYLRIFGSRCTGRERRRDATHRGSLPGLIPLATLRR